MARSTFTRRTILRGMGVGLTLPLLESLNPGLAWGGESSADSMPHRMICICSNMGMMPKYFWPEGEGRDYQSSEYLSLIEEHRNDFTVFSGVSHPEVDGGHHAEISFLTAAPHPASGGFKNSISLDQYAAERIGIETRFPYLTLGVGSENATLSWTASGVRIPASYKPSEVFRRMFLQGNAEEIKRQINQLRDGRSILDAVGAGAKRLERRVGSADRQKLDQYLQSIRELEERLVKAEAWENKPKPVVDAELPVDINDPSELIPRTRLMLNMARLAFQTDSTRVITLVIDENTNPKVNLPGVSEGHHSLTHHGQREKSVSQLKIIETAQMKLLSSFLSDLKGVQEGERDLLDRTMVLYGSNLGDANSHDNHNMPMILAGGGFKHGQLLAFDKKNNYPLPNLYVSMLQRMGIETDRFASSTGTMTGLDTV
ncbi:DUF1552 domain-containing protein [bacterium]|nr:DUF1552 domain-containing protein [bacterium]